MNIPANEDDEHNLFINYLASVGLLGVWICILLHLFFFCFLVRLACHMYIIQTVQPDHFFGLSVVSSATCVAQSV